MKRLILWIILVLAMAAPVTAATLKWDVSTGAEGYYVYYGTETGVYPAREDVGNVTEVPDIVNAFGLGSNTEYFFTVSAYNLAGESDNSNEANYTTPIVLSVPGTVTITITQE